MTTSRLIATLALAAGLAACGGQADDDPQAPSPTPTSTEASPVPSPSPRDVDPDLGSFVDVAVADLAERLDVPDAEITVVSAEMVSWGDTSLGCPQPGMRYAQVVTDGTRIVLEHDGTTYAYHSGGDRPDPFLCEQPEVPAGKSTPQIERSGDAEAG